MKKIQLKLLALYSMMMLFFYCKNDEIIDPRPVIFSISPLEAYPGERINISGTHLNSKHIKVFFEGTEGEIKSRSSKSIIVEVPVGAVSGKINVQNRGNILYFTNPFTVRSEPSITSHTITLHKNQRLASVLLSPQELDKLIDYQGNDDLIKGLIRDVYKKFEDDFDFIFSFKNNKKFTGVAGYQKNVNYHILGIGKGDYPYNFASEYGSSGKLKSIMAFNYIGFNNHLIYHELMHYWANFAFSTETYDYTTNKIVSAGAHWGFSGCGGALGGFDQSTLKLNVDGNPDKYSFSTLNFTGFSNFELYLMGTIGPTELEPFDVLTDVVQFNENDSMRYVEAKTRTTWDRNMIESTLGVRFPDYKTSQKNFKILTLVFTTIPLSEEEFNVLDDRLVKISRNFDDGESEINFWEATQGKGTLIVEDLQESLK